MDPQVKELWVNALRSGKYQQTTGKLKTSKGFCCLGVLTDLYLKEKNQEWDCITDSDTDTHYYRIEEKEDLLPASVKDWAGLYSISPQVMVENESYHPEHDMEKEIPADLAELNDDGLSFNEIANLIETQL